MPSQQQASHTPIEQRDTFQTPQWLFDYANKDQFPCEIDLAALPHNAKCDKFITPDEDALSLPWHKLGATGWCNPPYSETGKWLEKGKIEAQHNFMSMFLVPTPNGEIYWRHVFGWATEIIFITGRISFELPNTHGQLIPKTGNTRGSCIVVFAEPGEQDTTISWVDRDVIKDMHQQPHINKVKA